MAVSKEEVMDPKDDPIEEEVIINDDEGDYPREGFEDLPPIEEEEVFDEDKYFKNSDGN